jgi:TonB family protein
MKRLQRKCLVASAFTHGLLLVLVVVGSAFISHKPPIDAPAFELFDMQAVVVNEPNVLRGGNPNVTTPPQSVPQTPSAQPAVQEPKPELKSPEAVKEPAKEPVKEPVKPVVQEPRPEPKKQIDPDNFDLKRAITKAPTPKPEKPPSKFDFGKAETKTIIPSKDSSDSQENSRAQEKRMAQARAEAISGALKHVQGGLSSVGTSYEIPGPGGAAYVSYGITLRNFYEKAWIPPVAARGDEPTVEVEVVIAKDGTILSQRIVKKAGRRELDNSVQNTLNRVFKAKAPKFPEGSTDEKRTFRINFNLTDKVSVG